MDGEYFARETNLPNSDEGHCAGLGSILGPNSISDVCQTTYQSHPSLEKAWDQIRVLDSPSIVYDLTGANSDDWILAQNDLAQECFGTKTKLEGGWKGRIIQAKDLYHVFLCVITAIGNPGRVMETIVSVGTRETTLYIRTTIDSSMPGLDLRLTVYV